MRIVIVIADSIRDNVNARAEKRNGGPMFVTALANSSDETVAVAWICSWNDDGHPDKADAQGKFDLRDQIEGHAWLTGKLRTFDAQDRCTVTRSGTRIARVYKGDQWTKAAVMADLGLVPHDPPRLAVP